MKSETKQTTKKRKRKGGKAIPLVKGATAASLARKKQSESVSRSNRRRKRSRENSGSTTNNNSTNTANKSPALFSSTAESLAVISRFHTLNKRLEQNERDETISEKKKQAIAQGILKEQTAMGGLDRYQKASIYGAKSSKFVCADWVVPLLRQQTVDGKTASRLRILDVGAIDNQYLGHEDWLDAVPIDLHGGQHESVLQVDFFEYAHQYCSGTDLSEAKESPPPSSSLTSTNATTALRPFDAIVMSLVLNFQGDPRKRGDMLALAADPRLLKLSSAGGMLFLALPSASLENSRYCDVDRFVEVVTNPLFGLELVEQKTSSKLVLLALQRTAAAAEACNSKNKHCCYYNASKKTFDYGDHEMKRLPAKPGTKRNNFAVILKSSHNRT